MYKYGVLILALFFALPLRGAEPIKILDISSYSAGAAFAAPIRQGLDMIEEETNAAGGVMGRPIHFIHVDDTGTPGGGLTKLQQELLEEKPVFYTCGNFANIELAFSAFAKQNKVLQIGAGPNGDDAMWQEGHRYMFRGTGPLLYSFNWMLAERAARKGRTRWGTVNHNYAWGQQNLAAFKDRLAHCQPGAQWVEEQWTPIGKLDAGGVVNAMLSKNVDAVYTSLWGSDLIQFLREAKKRGLTEKAIIVGDNIGRPEFMEQAKGELPEGAITIGTLPFEHPVTPAMKAFAERYQQTYHQAVRYIGLEAYVTGQTIVAALKKANSLDTEKIIDALSTLQYETIFGPTTMRAIDHVPTNGLWVGEVAVKNGEATLVNVEYKDGKNYFPPDSYIENLRKK